MGSRAPVHRVFVDNQDLTQTFSTLTAGNRVLLVGQSQQVQNGLYTVTTKLDLERATDMATGSHAAGCIVGTLDGSAYVCIADPDADVVGTNNLVWVHTDSAQATRLVDGSADDRAATNRCASQPMRRVLTPARTCAPVSEWERARPCIAC